MSDTKEKIDEVEEPTLEITIEDSEITFTKLLRSIYGILFQYLKDHKTPNSWVEYYSDVLDIKFPSINFNEGYNIFVEKITKILDLMEISHLYCKVTNPKVYVAASHMSVVSTKSFITKELDRITQTQYEELLQHLKTSILFGNN